MRRGAASANCYAAMRRVGEVQHAGGAGDPPACNSRIMVAPTDFLGFQVTNVPNAGLDNAIPIACKLPEDLQ